MRGVAGKSRSMACCSPAERAGSDAGALAGAIAGGVVGNAVGLAAVAREGRLTRWYRCSGVTACGGIVLLMDYRKVYSWTRRGTNSSGAYKSMVRFIMSLAACTTDRLAS